MEGPKHQERITALIGRQNPDCICLQEMPEVYLGTLQSLGYYVTYAPMMVEHKAEPYICGVGMATKQPVPIKVVRYFGNAGLSIHRPREDEMGTVSYRYLSAAVPTAAGDIHVVTTHMLVTPDGRENAEQNACVDALFAAVDNEPPHIFCGDFNMPRGYNKNYERFLERYTDAVPASYASSLDRTLHRMGNNPTLNEPIFDRYMVDYVFTQPPFVAKNVTLEFGVSDHAAVIADIEIAD